MNWKIYCVFTLLMTVLCPVLASARDKDNEALSYDIKCAGNPQQGFYLVEVTAYLPKKRDISSICLRMTHPRL